jgi:hypothetical protein
VAHGGPSGVVVGSAVSGSVLVVLAAAAGVLVAMRRALSRRRLREGSPDARIEGAWSEFTDALRLAGRPLPPHLAASEAAAFAAAPPPARRGLVRRAAPAGGAAPAAGAASVGGAEAGGAEAAGAEAGGAEAGGAEAGGAAQTGGAVATVERPADALPALDELVSAINTVGFAPGAAGPGQAERAGEQAVAYADALREQLPWWRRAWWSVHPGPLRWPHRP